MPRKKPDESKQARHFGLMLLPILLGLAALAWWRGHARAATVLAALSVAPPVLALAATPLWLRFFRLWMKLAEGMSWVMTRVILSVFYFVMMTPIGVAMRLFRRDPLDLAWSRRKSSYWIDKAPVETTLERYEKQF